MYTAKWFSRLRWRERDLPVERYRSLTDFERHMRALIHYVKQDGVPVIVMTQSALYKAEMNDREKSVLFFGRTLCNRRVNTLQYEYPSPRSLTRAMQTYNESTRRIARSEEITCIDLARIVPKNLAHFIDDVHYTEAAAQLIAGHVAATLIQAGITPLNESDSH